MILRYFENDDRMNTAEPYLAEHETFGLGPPPKKKGPWLNVLLFIATFFTTTMAGAIQAGVNPFRSSADLLKGLPFSGVLMTILIVHEFGHYFASRYWGVKATLPYFIPFPSPLLGTMGAVIKIRSPIPNRKALVDIGAAGPLAGFVVASIACIVGLKFSQLKLLPPIPGESLMLGDSLFFSFVAKLIFPNVPPGYDIYLHPVAYAGWLGLLVTAMNLWPVGQLDGGHIMYSLFGKWHKTIARIAIILLIPLGFYYLGWLVWALVITLFGIGHPPPYDPYEPLDRKRKLIGYICIVVFILSLTPVPFKGGI